eukprot:gene14943-biopygen15705
MRTRWTRTLWFLSGHPPRCAGGAGHWREHGAGCKPFVLAWGGTGMARACPVPPGRNGHARVRSASVSSNFIVRPAPGPRPLPFLPQSTRDMEV